MKNNNKMNDRFNRFYDSFKEINKDIIYNNVDDKNNELFCHNLIIYNYGNEELILPHSYSILKDKKKPDDKQKATYICDNRGNIVCGFSYFDTENNSICKYPKKRILPHKEYILEHASIITEFYLGKEKEDYLKCAILKMIEGNYNYFTKYDNTRFKLVLIQRSKIPKVMISTLERNDIEFNDSSLTTIVNSYIDYIKAKTYSFDKTAEYKGLIKRR